MKKVFSAFLCFLMLFTAGMFMSNTLVAEASAIDKNALPNDLGEYNEEYINFLLVSKTDKIAMYFNELTANVAVLNMKSGYIWSSATMPSEYKPLESAGANLSKYQALFYYSVLEKSAMSIALETKMGPVKPAGDSVLTYDKTSVENGIRVKFYSKENDLKIDIDLYLDPTDNTLNYSVNSESIVESLSTKRVLTGMWVMPQFGAANDETDGYVFYPDGCGAISEFTPIHANIVARKTFYCYSYNRVDLNYMNEEKAENIMPVLYPVFGMKKGNNAFLGVVTENAENAAIVYAPSGESSQNLSRIFTQFSFRQICEYAKETGETQLFFSPSMTKGKYSVKYYFLEDDEANYSGMACAYRSYLLGNDMLNDAIGDNDAMPLALQLFMCTYIDRTLFAENVVMTTFDDAMNIISELYEDGIEDILINISNWQKKGISYQNVDSVSRQIGGKKGLKKFTQLAKEFGYDVFMQVNMLYANKNTSKFNPIKDATQNYSGSAVTDSEKKMYLIAPINVENRYKNIYKKYFEDTNISGLNYEEMAYLIYHSYANTSSSGTAKVDRATTTALWAKIIEQSRNDFGKAAAWYGNQYALKALDYIYDLPITDTGYVLSTETVPFAQIVLHGYIPYSSYAGNKFYDDELQTLKWIEYGYIPYYTITNNDSSLLTYTVTEGLFSTKFSDWKDRMVEKYKTMKNDLGFLYNESIVNHEMIRKNVYSTKYENGTIVYVNYNDYDVIVNNGKSTIKAKSYLVEKAGEY